MGFAVVRDLAPAATDPCQTFLGAISGDWIKEVGTSLKSLFFYRCLEFDEFEVFFLDTTKRLLPGC